MQGAFCNFHTIAADLEEHVENAGTPSDLRVSKPPSRQFQ